MAGAGIRTGRDAAGTRRRINLTAPGRSRLLGVGLSTATAVILFFVYLRMSLTVWTNSDGATNALQAWDLWHGNVLLSGWRLTDVSFYTVELPVYALVESAHGLSGMTVHIGAALIYTAVLFAACAVAKGGARGRQGVARVGVTALVLVAPAPGSATGILLLSPDHYGTSLALLLVLLLIDRRPTARSTPYWVALGLAWAAVSDTTAVYLGIMPILAVSGWRLLRSLLMKRPAGPDLRLTIAAGTGYLLGRLATWSITAAGGFTAVNPSARLAPISDWPRGLADASSSLLTLFGVTGAGAGAGTSAGIGTNTGSLSGWAAAGWAVHALGLALVLFAVARCLVHVPRSISRRGSGPRPAPDRASAVNAMLVIAILVNVAAFAFSVLAGTGPAAREICDVLPLGAALAGRVSGAFLASRLGGLPGAAPSAPSAPSARRRSWHSPTFVGLAAAVCLAGCAALGYGVSRPYTSPPSRQLANWLAAHGLHYGLAYYWDAAVISADSGTAVRVRPVELIHGALRPPGWDYCAIWYDPKKFDARFVVTNPLHLRMLSPADVERVYGPPAAIYTVAGEQILVYHSNLLDAVRPGTAPGGG